MKKSLIILIVLFISAYELHSEENNQKSVSVTVYNENLGVVKDLRGFDMKEGVSEIEVTGVASRIKPTTVHVKMNGSVLEQNYRYDLADMDAVLQRYIDREITLIGENDTFSGRLLSFNNSKIVVEQKDGGVIMLPDYKDYRLAASKLPEGLLTKPTLAWIVDSRKSGRQEVEITYQTEGMRWSAEYVAVLNEDDSQADVNAWVTIGNRSGASYEDAKLKLVAGDVNMVKEKGLRGQFSNLEYARTADGAGKQFEEKEFFEYHIYHLQRNSTIRNNETKQISLFEAGDVSVEKRFVYNSSGNNNENGKPGVYIEFANSEKNNLGVPMPKGKFRLYKSDGGDVEFIGEDEIDHTPRSEKVKLRVGDAFDIRIDEKIVETKKLGRSLWENTYEITVKNRKKETAAVYIDRNLYSDWEVLETNIDFEKVNAFKIRFKVDVSAGEEKTLTYKVRFSN